jgi:SAM-dependent methyltransferase
MTSTTGSTADSNSAQRDSLPFAPLPDGWKNEDQVTEYLERVGVLPPRLAGEEALISALPAEPSSVLDLGAGDGRLAALVAATRPSVDRVVLLDNSPPMLDRARSRFAGDKRFEIHDHDLQEPLSTSGGFDVVVSGFAIHHLEDARKQTLFSEICDRIEPGGIFGNLEVVKSPTPELHRSFLDAIGRTAEDPEDRLADVWTQLNWLEEAGFDQVDCLWKWRGFALMVGTHPAP